MTQRPSLVQASVLSLAAIVLAPSAAAIELDPLSVSSIWPAAQQIAEGLVAIYHDPNSTAGDFIQDEPWFWWLSGSAWSGLMDYAVYTKDTIYTPKLLAALAENVGENNDFAPAAQKNWEANDDQAYWLFNALTALEYEFEALPCDTKLADGSCANSWLNLAINTFKLFTERWAKDNATCGGGLKWQYDPKAKGYDYKNSVSNGGFFQTAARLARYTGNASYAEWADTIWDWTESIGLISDTSAVFDGAGDKTSNCTEIDTVQWSYNAATYLHGAAHMYAYTNGGTLWEARVLSLVANIEKQFFSPSTNVTGIMFERCEPTSECTTDQTSFKSSLARWMGKTAMLVPPVKDRLMNLLASSATAAAASCVPGAVGPIRCGMRWWWAAGFDGRSNIGSQLSALEVVQSLMVTEAPQLAKLKPS